ncbi:SEL1-like repeat protein [Avibacterium paragallinarum]|uniref:SEL1-like repeat protein n=1 Tax=Avibacterium paragallinarum TaxID=728 RepID=UPI0012678087
MLYLADLYIFGKGVTRNQEKAEYYLRLSANQGNTKAIELLDILNKGAVVD